MDLLEKTENTRRHPWEMSRSYNIIKLLRSDADHVFADIGAGDRFLAARLTSITNRTVYAVDNQYDRSEFKEDGVTCLNDSSLLEDSSIDCLIMMDVLEHVENENAFLTSLLKKLKPGGKIIITVPAMQFLFSSHDVFLKHFRRYSRKKLISLLSNNNIIIDQCHYFYTSLFFARCLSRLLEVLRPANKRNEGIGMWGHDEKSFVTRLVLIMLNIDFSMNKLLNGIFIHFPGLSIIAICRKRP